MSLSIDLTPETEDRLEEEAARRGLDLNQYARLLIEQSLLPQVPAGPSLWNTLTADEWIREFKAWSDGHRGLPALPPEAYERASFYEGRE